MSESSNMPIIFKLCIPNKVVRKVRVLLSDSVSIINRIPIFSPNNKILYISNGMILPYCKSMKECNISDGDQIFGLNITDNISEFEEILKTNELISIMLIKNIINVFGPIYDANMASINKMISISSSPDVSREKIYIFNKETSKEMARIKDLRYMKKEMISRSWRNKRFSLQKQNIDEINYSSLANINYIPPDMPCTEEFPILF